MKQLRPLTPIINAADASKDETSAAITTGQVFYVSAQVVMTGASSGTLKLQFSNDLCLGQNGQEPSVPTNWSDIPNATVTLTGTPGVFAIAKTELSYAYIRAVYTKNNGSAGTITVLINGMGN